MEKRFRLFLICVICAAVTGIAVMGTITVSRLQDSETRLEQTDKDAFAELAERCSDPANVAGVQVQVKSTMGDYARYKDFDPALLGGLQFGNHEYLWGGSGEAVDDITVTVTLYTWPKNTFVRRLLALSDKYFDTDYLTTTEKVVMVMDGDVYRVTYGETNFVVTCGGMTEWILNRMNEKE